MFLALYVMVFHPSYYRVVSFLLTRMSICMLSFAKHFCSAFRFNERGSLFSREEVRALQVGPGGLLFSGDSHGSVKVWRWQKGE